MHTSLRHGYVLAMFWYCTAGSQSQTWTESKLVQAHLPEFYVVNLAINQMVGQWDDGWWIFGENTARKNLPQRVLSIWRPPGSIDFHWFSNRKNPLKIWKLRNTSDCKMLQHAFWSDFKEWSGRYQNTCVYMRSYSIYVYNYIYTRILIHIERESLTFGFWSLKYGI